MKWGLSQKGGRGGGEWKQPGEKVKNLRRTGICSSAGMGSSFSDWKVSGRVELK